MPPSCIAASDVSTVSRASGAGTRALRASRNSIGIDCGNFGAPPKPPCSASCSDTMPAPACASNSSLTSSSAAARPDAFRSAPVRTRAFSSTASRFVR